MIELRLNATDDLLTAKKKIDDAGTNQAILVIPSGSVLSTPVNMRLLIREVQKNGISLTLRSDDAKIQTVIDNLRQVEVPSPGEELSGTAFVVGQDVATGVSPKIGSEGSVTKTLTLSFYVNKLVTLINKLQVSLAAKGVAAVLTVIVGVGVFLAVLFSLFNYSHKAVVRITVVPEGVVKNFAVVASPKLEEVDAIHKIIPAQLVTIKEVGSESTKATGSQVVGERATGVVTIYNKTDEAKQFAKGDKITLVHTADDIRNFYLEESVSVNKREITITESSPGNELAEFVSGKSEVSVIAEQIGEEYNLKEGETFTIADLPISSFVVQNDNSFKGGSKKEVIAVAAEDLTRLESSLQESLSNTSLKRLQDEVKDVVVHEGAIEIKVLSRNYDQQVGATAAEVTLTMEVEALAYTYDSEDLQQLLEDALGGHVPDRFVLSGEEQQIDIEGVLVKNGELNFYAKVTGLAIPKLDDDKIKEDIKGKREDAVYGYLTSLSNVASVNIVLSPRLPKSLQRFPSDVSKITVDISHERE